MTSTNKRDDPLQMAIKKAGDFAELMQRGQSGSVVQRDLPPPVAHPLGHGSTNKRDGGEVELLPLPECDVGFPGQLKFAHSPSLIQAYARANVEHALAESRAECERLRHKAEQYDSVVERVKPADGGRYRADTISRIDAVYASRDHHKARAERLAGALRIAHRHIDMDALRVSHCNDAAEIDAALEQEPQD